MRHIILGIIFTFSFHSWATHIIGGEINYECLPNNQYEVKLKLYRDCFNGLPPFDNPAIVTAYDSQGKVVEVFQFSLPTSRSDTLPVIVNNPCLQAPPDVCVEKAVYSKTITLPPIPGGYHLVYQRCCRNKTILNIYDPEDVGSSYYTVIPDANEVPCNSNPEFKNFPPIALCAGDALKFDHSASDLDGDSLFYELCDPFIGGSVSDPAPNPSSRPPYDLVKYKPPYSATYPLDASPPLTIDPNTGLLTGTPTKLGQFVVGVCVNEYRNGKLLSTNKRDFQFNVVHCLSNVTASTPSNLMHCDGSTVQFNNESENAWFYHWDFGVSGVVDDTSSEVSPKYTYPDTGRYDVMLIANPGYTCADTAIAKIGVYPGLKTDFKFVSKCADEDIVFTDQSITSYGDIVSWEWDFGDNFGKSTQRHPTYNYFSGEEYEVQLVTTTTIGCKDTLIKKVKVFPEPQAGFEHTPACIGQPVLFSNKTALYGDDISLYLWDFGDNSRSNVKDPEKQYGKTGKYEVNLIVKTVNNCHDTVKKMISVGVPPVADAGPDMVICSGDSARIGSKPDVDHNYIWNPTSGLSDSTSSAPFVKLVNQSTNTGKFNYTVRIQDMNTLCSASDTVEVTVYPYPQPDIAVPDGQCIRNNNYNLSSIGSFNSGAEFFWEFGDKATPSISSERFPRNISFNKPGQYPITLTVKENGCARTDTDTVIVYSLVQPDFEILETQGCHPHTVQFYDSSQADAPLKYKWVFGDGEFSTEQNPVHVYVSPGSYSISLTVIGSKGCLDTVTVTRNNIIVVNPRPKAGMDIFPQESNITDPDITFGDESSGANSCMIILTTGDTLNDCNAVYSFQDTGTYSIQQIVYNEYGCGDTVFGTVVIKPEYRYSIPNAFTPNGDGENDIFNGKGFGIKKFQMFIYDRWGLMIYKTDDSFKGWNGKPEGSVEVAPEDVYVYIIRITDVFEDDHKYIGRVTLIK